MICLAESCLFNFIAKYVFVFNFLTEIHTRAFITLASKSVLNKFLNTRRLTKIRKTSRRTADL